MARHVIAQSGAPAAAPEFIGQHYVNTDNGDHYLAGGTASASDWGDPVGSGSGVNPQTIYDNGVIADPLAVDVANGFVQSANNSNSLTSFTITPAAPPDTAKAWRIYLYINNPSSAFMNIVWSGVTLPSDSQEEGLLTGNGSNLIAELVYMNPYSNGGWHANLIWSDYINA